MLLRSIGRKTDLKGQEGMHRYAAHFSRMQPIFSRAIVRRM
ncbi:uncharacterized protein CHAB577_0149 [Chlamydia abortus]|nr:uncharacterized protein CHAB577_0149 [Chlamydia abortus]